MHTSVPMTFFNSASDSDASHADAPYRILNVYVNDHLNHVSMGYHADVAKTFSLKQQEQQQRSSRPPYMILKTGSAPEETCYDTGEEIFERDLQAVKDSGYIMAPMGTLCPQNEW